jgi:hypothetical protein
VASNDPDPESGVVGSANPEDATAEWMVLRRYPGEKSHQEAAMHL